MKRFLILAVALLLFCGCAGSGVKIDVLKNAVNEKDMRIYTETAQISLNSEFAQKINKEIADGITEETENFRALASESETEDDELEIRHITALSQNGIVSIITDCREFTGGMHSELKRAVKNIDLEKECEIAFSDLFCDDKFTDRINAYIEQVMASKPNKYADLWKKPHITADSEFYLTKSGVVVYYPPYELSYYSRGFVEFEIPYDELDGYLNPEYIGRIY